MTSKRTLCIAFASLASAAAACGSVPSDPDPETTAYTYRTTSNVGDLSTWTIDGNSLTVEWKDIAPGTGDVEKTFLAAAVCGTPDADFGYRTCMIDGDAQCIPGTEPCAADDGPKNGDTIRVFEVPGMALVASATYDDQLHAGFASDDCASVITDDYTFVNIGLGQEEVLGLFRTDSAFDTVHHMDFGFSDDPVNQISYVTRDPAGLVNGITAGPCVNGVRELTIDQTNEKIRLMVTAAGHLVLDKPEGQGGMLAISAENAAVIADFANKSWGGIAFPDDRAPEYIDATTGAASNGQVQLTSIVLSSSGDITPATPVYINDGTAGSKLNESLAEPDQPYASNFIVASGDYTAGPSELPGAFEIDSVSGDETAIVGIGATVDGRTMLFGSVVNQYEDARNGVKGNFILIEK